MSCVLTFFYFYYQQRDAVAAELLSAQSNLKAAQLQSTEVR